MQAQFLTCMREEETFEVLHVIEFNRARKRIPILVHAPSTYQVARHFHPLEVWADGEGAEEVLRRDTLDLLSSTPAYPRMIS